MLCRILTELKLLDTSVGVITLSAGVANDVVGVYFVPPPHFEPEQHRMLTRAVQDGFFSPCVSLW